MNDRSTPMADQPKLQLKATDSEDIETLSALLQDALIGGSDMAYDKIEGCFVFLANRYCWELEEASYRCLWCQYPECKACSVSQYGADR